MASPMSKLTVERKIFFYRADIGKDKSGAPLSFDPMPVLDAVNELPFDSDARYEIEDDGNTLSLMGYSNNTTFPFAQFGRTRRSGLPQVEQSGQVSDLQIPNGSGLLEPIHVVFFPNNVVGSEYNHFGPRLSRFGSYLSQKCKSLLPDRVHFHPLLRGDAAEQLDRLGEIRVVDMSIYPSYEGIVRQADVSLADAFAAANRAFENPETVQLVLKLSKESRVPALAKYIPPFKRLLTQDLHQNSKRFLVRGKCADTDKVETIDLLKDYLVSVKSIIKMRGRGRALDTDDAVRAISEAYEEVYDYIATATGVSQ